MGCTQYRRRLTTVETLQAMERLHKLIKANRTGGLREMGEALHMDKNSVRRLLQELELFGGHVEYDRIQKTYYYSDPYFNFEIKVTVHEG